MEELKRCPFCGKKAQIIKNTAHRKDGIPLYHVCCNSCSIGQFTWSRDRDSVIAEWNSRYEGDDRQPSSSEGENNAKNENLKRRQKALQ
jgi:Lar family restriction alleviation protein